MTQELNQKDLRKIDFERVKIETITVLIATDTHLTSCSVMRLLYILMGLNCSIIQIQLNIS